MPDVEDTVFVEVQVRIAEALEKIVEIGLENQVMNKEHLELLKATSMGNMDAFSSISDKFGKMMGIGENDGTD